MNFVSHAEPEKREMSLGAGSGIMLIINNLHHMKAWKEESYQVLIEGAEVGGKGMMTTILRSEAGEEGRQGGE